VLLEDGYGVVERFRRALGETRSVWRGEDRKGKHRRVAECFSVLSDILGAEETILHPVLPFDILGGRRSLGHRGRVGVDVPVLLALRHAA
jgi:hypothetical protein